MEAIEFEGVAYSQVRRKVHEFLENNPDIVIERIDQKREPKSRVIRIYYTRKSPRVSERSKGG